MADDTQDLALEMHFADDLLTSSALVGLQAWLSVESPRMAGSLEVHAYERDRDRILVELDNPQTLRTAVRSRGLDRGKVYHQLAAEHGVAEGERRFGSVLLRGRGSGTGGRFLSVGFDSQTPLHRMGDTWLWSNTIGATVTPNRVEGVNRSDWVRSLARRLAREPDFLWGAAYLSAEFHASNIDTRGGLRAIGRNARRHLPGLYWLNFFGPAYSALMDVESARGSGLGRWEDVGDAVAVECYLDPEDWEDGTENKTRIMQELGADLFFDRDHRRRPTRAPDFALPASTTVARR